MHTPSTPTKWPDRMADLPATLDRFRATCVYFDIKFPPFLTMNPDALKWTSWGALAALASIPEVFEREIGRSGFETEWRDSPERKSIQDDPLLSLLRELRNFETHLEFLGRRMPSEMNSAAISRPTKLRSSFFAKIDFSVLCELRNIKTGRSAVTQQSVEDFNRLAETETVESIVDLALDSLSGILSSFVKKHNI